MYHGLHVPFTDTTKLGLCPIMVRGGGGSDQYVVINREGREAITTSKAGVDAIRLLAKGRTVAHTRRILGERHRAPSGEIDLAPLLETLLASGFVRTLDGRRIGSGGKPVRPGLRFWLTLHVWSPLLLLAFKVLSPARALRLAYGSPGTASNPELERRIVENLRRAPALGQPERQLARIAADNAQALRKQFCDRLLLTSLPRQRLRAWLRGMPVTGLEQLARAGARGRGAILCSFHLGSYGLIPFVLGALGIPVTVYGGFGEDARTNVTAWLAEHLRRGDGYPVRFVGGRTGLRALVRCLERGETVLLYCDPAQSASGSQGSGTRGQGPGSTPRPELHGQIRVPFMGTHVWSAKGAGWLRRRTGAALLPGVLLWEGRRGHHLRIDAELAGDPGGSDADDMVAVFAALEAYVRQHPDQWLRWPDFGGMVAPEA